MLVKINQVNIMLVHTVLMNVNKYNLVNVGILLTKGLFIPRMITIQITILASTPTQNMNDILHWYTLI